MRGSLEQLALAADIRLLIASMMMLLLLYYRAQPTQGCCLAAASAAASTIVMHLCTYSDTPTCKSLHAIKSCTVVIDRSVLLVTAVSFRIASCSHAPAPCLLPVCYMSRLGTGNKQKCSPILRQARLIHDRETANCPPCSFI
jgi:hypothetical protein